MAGEATIHGWPSHLTAKGILTLGFRLELLVELFRSKSALAHMSSDGDTVDLDPFLGLIGLQVDDAWVKRARRLDGDVPVG